MGLFGKSDKEKEQEAKEKAKYEAAQRRMQEAQRKRTGAQAAPGAPAPHWATTPGNVPASGGRAGMNLPAGQSPATTGDGGTYTVVSGDSLSKIAKKHLGSAGRWKEIYEANRSVIGDDPDLIKPGQKLRLPAGASKPLA